MTELDLLEMMGEAQEKHIVSAIRTVKKKGKGPMFYGRKLLIAAAIVSLLSLTAFAAEYVGTLFETYFREDGRRDLTPEQVEFIGENTQPSIASPILTDPENGYSVSVRSALTDGNVAYITVDIKAPEGINLEGGQIRFHENPLLIPDRTEGLSIAPDGSSPDAMCDYSTIDDGDGLSNTASIMFYVNPFKEETSLKPFDGSIHWTMKAGSFYNSFFDSEEIEFSELGKGIWEFDLNFQKLETKEVSFLSEPLSVMTSYWPGDDFINENQILAFTLSGLSYHMELAKTDIDGEHQNIGDTTIVMKDGTSQTLLRLTAQTASLHVPIVVENVDYILLTDGTRLYPQ